MRAGRIRSRACALAACLAAGAVFVAGCGSDDKNTDSAKSDVKVNIASFKFIPKDVKLKAGGTITWTNQDKAPHTATSDEGAPSEFNTERLDLSSSKPVKLDTPGKYSYYCIYHRFMTGTVEVVD